jgi:SNF2 family DNA or RNA helicase
VSFNGKLKPFQEEAYEKMLARQQVLVGYEMGLGKTVVTIATVETLLDEGRVDSGLVIVPSALKYQWEDEIKKFSTDPVVMVVDGTPDKRKRQYQDIKAGGIEYAILNYEQVVNDWQWVRHLRRDYVVIDEATAIKNPGVKRSRRIKKLGAPYRFGLTGQPVENRAEEIYSIMQWVDKTVLGDPETFDSTFIVRDGYGNVKRYKNLPLLHATLKDAMVRKTRLDPDVAPFLPKVTDEVIAVDFDKKSAALYRYIVNDLLAELATVKPGQGWDVWAHYGGESSGGEEQGRIMSKLTCLRMLCDHPALLRKSADLYDETHQHVEGLKAGSAYAAELLAAGMLDGLPEKSPKLKETIGTIKEILSANPKNKVVLFSFFKEMLNLIQAELGPIGSVQFNGDMSAPQKQAAKKKFQNEANCKVFLSSDAGGYGVDLPNANYLISYDLPWSAGKMDQRNARIIRLSSEFNKVTLMYMLMHGSIEERIFRMLEQKRAIASAIVDGKGIDTKGNLHLGLDSLKDFLVTTDV